MACLNFYDIPGIFVACGIIVPNTSGGFRAPATPGLSVGEVPCKVEGKYLLFTCMKSFTNSQGSHGILIGPFTFLGQHSIGTEIIPEIKQGVRPAIGY